MARQITSGIIHPVTLFDADGNVQGATINGTVALGASELHVGQVGGETTIVSTTPTITAGAYAAKDAVGGLLTFTNAMRVLGGSGLLVAVTVIDDGNQAAELVLTLFNQTFTNTADNAPFDPTDADLENNIGIVRINSADYQSFNDNAVGCAKDFALPVNSTGWDLYGQLMCVGTPTYTATSDLTVKLHILND